MNDLILYTTEDGRSQIKLRAKDQTVWLTQREMAQLFDVSTDNVGLHLRNIFEDGELGSNSVTEESSVTPFADKAGGKNKRSESRGLRGETTISRHGAEFHLPTRKTYGGRTEPKSKF